MNSENGFAEFKQTEASGSQSVRKRRQYTLYTLKKDGNKQGSEKDEDNRDIFQRLKTLEENQTVLSIGQSTIVNNQQLIAHALERIEASMTTKPEMMAQSKLLMECKIAIQKIEDSIHRMTGETSDTKIDEVASMLPLKTTDAVEEVEKKLENPEFSQAMKTYLHKVKGVSDDVESVIRMIMTDDLLESYNWEGRWEKNALAKLSLIDETLRDVFQRKGTLEFKKSVRKAIGRSHNRQKQKKFCKKSKS